MKRWEHLHPHKRSLTGETTGRHFPATASRGESTQPFVRHALSQNWQGGEGMQKRSSVRHSPQRRIKRNKKSKNRKESGRHLFSTADRGVALGLSLLPSELSARDRRTAHSRPRSTHDQKMRSLRRVRDVRFLPQPAEAIFCRYTSSYRTRRRVCTRLPGPQLDPAGT